MVEAVKVHCVGRFGCCDFLLKTRPMSNLLEDESTLVIDFHANINKETVGRFQKYSTDLIKKHRPKAIYLALSSTGGENRSAFVLYNFLLSLDFELVTHCTGVVDSCAVSIFLAGETRYSNRVSRFIIHAPSWTFKAETKLGIAKLREHVQIMEWDQSKHEMIICERTGATAEQVSGWHTGKVLSVEEALEHNFIGEIRQFVRPKRFFRFAD